MTEPSNHEVASTLACEARGMEQTQGYTTPELVVVGTATELVQGYAGRYYDGYAGYYTDRRG